jgi:hypothetical protein
VEGASLFLYYKWWNTLFDVQRSMFDVYPPSAAPEATRVRRSSFICPQGVDSSLKYVEWAKKGVFCKGLEQSVSFQEKHAVAMLH